MFLKINTMSVVTNSQRSSFVLENYFVLGLPHISIIRYVNNPFMDTTSLFQAVEDLVQVLNNGLTSVVLRNSNINPNHVSNVRFYLYPTIQGYSNSLLEDISESPRIAIPDEDGPVVGRRTVFNLGNVTSTKILNILNDKINQSGRSYTIKQLDWHVLFDQQTILGGRGKRGPYKQDSLVSQYYKGYRINCAAYAISRSLEPEYIRPRDQHKRNKAAYNLQKELGWGDTVFVIELKQFVDFYPKYRISCLYLKSLDNSNNTFEGEEYKLMTTEEKKKHWIYISYDFAEQHFSKCTPTESYVKSFSNSKDFMFCDWCVLAYKKGQHEGPESCKNTKKNRKDPKKQVKCPCGQWQKHNDCSMYTCPYCKTDREKNDFNHRCIIQVNEKLGIFEGSSMESSDEVYGLWVYDLESRIQIVPGEIERISTFGINEDKFSNINIYSKDIHKHEANLAVIRNVFTDQQKIYYGDDCVNEMYNFLETQNKGKNVIIAHNASGYDSRLLFEKLIKTATATPSVIFRGSKIIQLKFRKNTFIDSMLHVQGSLRKLAKEYGYTNIRKGHFPHLFNSIENYNYVGPIPGKEFFDLPFMFKDKKELEEFDVWYDSWSGKEWNFKKELLDYCIDDVLILQAVVKGYHENAYKLAGISPWFFSTAPSFCHNYVLTNLVKGLNIPDNPDRLLIEDLAKTKFWATLIGPEYYFARKALRGGRTEIRNIYHVVSDEDWARGVRIRYQDICSEYPFQQVVHDFPVGTPTINVWDLDYKPCRFHRNRFMCGCIDKPDFTPLDVVVRNDMLNINEHSFFGIVCVTLKAPKDLFHPVLVCMDLERNKCVASLEDKHLTELTCTSVELQAAVRKGYQIIKVHRYDQYTRKKSLWREMVLKFYIEKMINAGDVPDNIEELIFKYQQVYGVGADIRKAVDEGRFKNNPGLKQTAKIMINSMWGKHAQRPDMVTTKIIDHTKDKQLVDNIFINLEKSVFDLKCADYLGNDTVMYQYKETEEKSPFLHEGYIPAAVFVPAYGRLQLWEQLDRLGDRVLMNDTDSIVYIYDPLKYNIPEGEMLGEWEVEGIDRKNGGIRKFVGLGPKTYGIKCENGVTQIKAKGLSIKLAHSELINFEVMEKMALEHLQTNQSRIIKVPQFTFKWDVYRGMRTMKIEKDFTFKPEEMKGVLVKNILYPFGHNICDI